VDDTGVARVVLPTPTGLPRGARRGTEDDHGTDGDEPGRKVEHDPDGAVQPGIGIKAAGEVKRLYAMKRG